MKKNINSNYKVSCENCNKLVYERDLNEKLKCRFCEE